MSLSLLKFQLNQQTMAEKMKKHVDNQQQPIIIQTVNKKRSMKDLRHEANEKNKEMMLLRKTKTISKDKHKKIHAVKNIKKIQDISDF